MTLEDAIKHCEYVADSDCYGAAQMACAEEHRQLAEWLKELKAIHDEIDDAADEDEIFIGYLRQKMRGY